jgi:hypothetical protein
MSNVEGMTKSKIEIAELVVCSAIPSVLLSASAPKR